MFDVTIIGAGVIGSAIARNLSRYNLKTLVLEKGVEVCQGTSKANSAIIHGGFDAKENTLKAKLNVQGCHMYPELCKELNVDYKNNGSLVIAFSEKEMENIEALYQRGIKNGATNLEKIGKDKLKEIEPHINDEAVGALWCKSSGIVCPFNLTVALMENAINNGVELKLENEVLDIKKLAEENAFEIKTNKETIKTKYVINAAGVYSDKINNMIGGDEFYIIPRKGEYKVLEKSEGIRANATLFSCPTAKGKGVLVSQTVHGNLLVGPTAQQVEIEDNSTTKSGLAEVTENSKRIIKDIDYSKTITSFAGIRATPNTGDFMIFNSTKADGFINVGGIESPGLASAPAIAVYVENILKGLIEKNNETLEANKDFNPIREKNIPFIKMSEEEKKQAILQDDRYKKIICRCENITEAEIVDAINRPCGARTVDGVKRRVRPGMGRCQGGFCGPRVVEILARELNMKPEDVLKDYEKSNILVGKVK